MRRLIKSLLAYIFFALLSLAFFSQLFFPTLKIYYPADFSTSDLINVSLSLKHYLASSLAQNQLPFVSLKVGNGFPILAESQIGAFNLYNLFLYKFVPIIWAFNITYVLSMIVMMSFGYLLGQYLWHKKSIAIFFTITFAFSTAVFLKIVHQDLLKAIALIPALFYFFLMATDRHSNKLMVLSAFIAGQQFLLGHYFYSLATNIFLLILIVYEFYRTKKLKLLKLYFVYILIFLLIASPQLVQTLLFLQYSTRSESGGGVLYNSAFESQYLLTFLHPFPFGQIKNGDIFTSAMWLKSKMSPWEGNLFTGFMVPIILIYASFRKFLAKNLRLWTHKWPHRKLFFILFILSFLFMFGGKTPFRIIFSLPLINGFRALARFSALTVFFGLICFGYLLKELNLNKYVYGVIISLQLVTFAFIYHQYYPTVSPALVLNPPPIVKYLKQHHGSVYEYGVTKKWSQTFYNHGYQALDKYLLYQNGNFPYLNLMHDVPTCGIFKGSGFNDRYYSAIIKSLDYSLSGDAKDKTLSNQSQQLLNHLGCSHLISTVKYKNITPRLTYRKLFVYKLEKNSIFAQFYSITESYYDDQDFLNLIVADKTGNRKLYLKNTSQKAYSSQAKVTINKISDQKVGLQVESTGSGYVFIRIYNFNGWQATINNKPVPIEQANLNYMAVPISGAGQHQVKLFYQPPLWKITFLLTVVGYVLVIIVIVGIVEPNTHSPDDSGSRKP